MLIARVYEVFPLVCPICGGRMRIIAFITNSADIRQILEWDGCDAQMGEGVYGEPDWDEAAQPAPDDEVDQCVSW